MDKSFDLGALLKKNVKNTYKNKPIHFTSMEAGVSKRLQNNLKCRKSNRLTLFDSTRNLSPGQCNSPKPPPMSEAELKIQHRKQQLEKWKEEKERHKKELASKKKKPFLTGIPQKPINIVLPPPLPKLIPSTSGRVTRSQTRNKSKADDYISFAPKNAGFKAPQIKNLKKIPKLVAPVKVNSEKLVLLFEPFLPTIKEKSRSRGSTKKPVKEAQILENKKVERRDTKSKIIPQDKKKLLQVSRASSGVFNIESSNDEDSVQVTHTSRNEPTKPSAHYTTHNSTPKNKVPKSESSSEEKLRVSKSPDARLMTPEQIADESQNISPRVTMSRGKDNARREMKKKLEQGLLGDDAGDSSSVDHFRRQLASETERLHKLCAVWEQISEQVQLPDFVQDHILVAVGQARLLASQKLAQFGTLIQRCEKESGGPAVSVDDLHGFWDMVFMQVENVDMRFKKLEEMKARDWCEEQPVAVTRKPRAKPPAKAKPAATSRIKDMIAAARRGKQSAPPASERTFEGGFFSVSSPPRAATPPRTTPRATSPGLLRAVLSSEAHKASDSKSASFAMLRASVLGRHVECDGVAPLPQTPLVSVDLSATPGRSCLKQQTDSEVKHKRSIKIVLFNDNDLDSSTDQEVDKITRQQSPDDTVQEHTDYRESPHNSTEQCSRSSMPAGAYTNDSKDHHNDSSNDKENMITKPILIRQNALNYNIQEISSVMTRSRRKTLRAPQTEEKKKSKSKKKVLEESHNVEGTTPRRSTRNRKSCPSTLL